MNKIKKLAEDFLAKYPTMFSADFEANKKGVDQIAVIHNRTLRNQIAGAITVMAKEKAGTAAAHLAASTVSDVTIETVEEKETVAEKSE